MVCVILSLWTIAGQPCNLRVYMYRVRYARACSLLPRLQEYSPNSRHVCRRVLAGEAESVHTSHDPFCSLEILTSTLQNLIPFSTTYFAVPCCTSRFCVTRACKVLLAAVKMARLDPEFVY